MTRMVLAWLGLIFLLTGAEAAAADSGTGVIAPGKLVIPAGPPLVTASPLVQAPVMDGQGADPVWAGCLEVKDVLGLYDCSLPANETTFRLGYTADTLYGLVECSSRAAQPKVTVRDHDGPVSADDCIEIYLEPQAGSGKYYQFAANSAGVRYEGCGMDKNWNSAWEAAATVKEGKWTLEFAIPLATLGIKPGARPILGFNLARHDLAGRQLQSWAYLEGITFHNPSRFGRLALGERGLGAASLISIYRDQNRILARGTLRNKSDNKQNIRWLLAGSAEAKAFRFEESQELAAGASATVEQEAKAGAAGGWLSWRSSLSAGDTVLYVSPVLQMAFLRLPVLGRPPEPLVAADADFQLDKNGRYLEPVAKGQRVFTCGHSLHFFVPPLLADLAKSAGFKDHVVVGLSAIGGSHVSQHWDVPDGQNQAKAALRAGQVDVLTLSPLHSPDEGILAFAKLALEHNPHIRITVEEIWMPFDLYQPTFPDCKFIPETVDHNLPTGPELRELHEPYFKNMDGYLRDLNRRLGKDVLLAVPAGQAVIALREKVIAGQAPGLKTQEELFGDTCHPGPLLQALVAYCHFAVIYRRSPVGLPMPAARNFYQFNSMKTVDNPQDAEKMNRLLQEIAWDTVIRHPLSGIKARN